MVKVKALAGIATIALILAIGGAAGPAANAAGPTAVGLGTTASFAVLAGSGITNTGASVVNGDIGSFPTTTISGFPPGTVTAGNTNHGGDAVTQGAKSDLVTAYGDAAGRTPAVTVPTELGGTTLTGGIYTSAAGTFGITGALTLDGGGNPSSVWIFQMASTLTTATSSSVVLIGSAQSCNVFWQVGSSATLGGGTTFRGNILALTSITLVTGATVDGRLLARNGAVTLDTNTITKATCAAIPTSAPFVPATATPTTATPTPVPTITPIPTATPVGTATPVPTATPAATPAPTAAPTLAPTPAPTITPRPSPSIVQLPSTGTSGDSPIAAVGLMLAGLGAAILFRRRRGVRG